MKTLVISFLLALVCGTMNARQDSVRVSLMTCAPGTEIYALFGHTALRYENPAKGQDLVFNYGMFSFRAPNFVWRFVKGETDYQLGIAPYPYFEAEYAMRGSSVYQQELNLTPAEKQRLYDLLEENYRPENRVYRYNFFYDNCTTRARDRIESSIAGKVVYPEGEEQLSFRDIVHQYTEGHPWDELGIDLCLGAEADKPIAPREQMFAPFYLLAAARGARIVRDGSEVPLVREETTVVEAVPDAADGFPLSPRACAYILIGITLLLVCLEQQRKRIFWLWDLLLYGAQGVGGCIIAFLFFFSVHPTVGSNWMLALLNPLPLLYLPFMAYRAAKGKKDVYHGINAVYLMFFIMIMPFIPQKFNAVVLPLALCLLVYSASHVVLYYRLKNK